MSCPKTLLLAGVAGLSLFAAVPAGRAIQWKSSFYKCLVDLPETTPITGAWTPMAPSSRGEDEAGVVTLAGARRADFSGFVFLGVIPLDQKSRFQLTEKTLSELEKRYFGTGLGFLHSTQPLQRKDGLPGYLVTGSHCYHGTPYNIVVDFIQANNMIYEIGGLSQFQAEPLKDPDIRGFMQSFRTLR